MAVTTQSELSRRLHEMRESVLLMGVLIEEALQKVIFALETRDYDLADEIVRDDRRIDALEVQIDDHCTRIISTTHPDERDLRDVLTTIKLTSALERVGDHARHIARRARIITGRAFVPTLPTIRTMIELNITMLHDLLTAYVAGDADHAREIATRDDELDRLHACHVAQVATIMREGPEHIDKGLEVMLVSRSLERFGDQITNMCELVILARNAVHVELNGEHHDR
jgi:phosphate transport system protein